MRNLLTILLFLPLLAVRDHRYLPAKYYFSATGSDGGAGTIGSPWQTAPKFNGLTLAAGDSVFFKGGDKFNGTFRLNQSGSLGNQIVIASYGTGNAIFTGFASLSGFTNVSGNIYEATCSGCAAYVNEVRFNGNDQYMGRWPDTSNGKAGYRYQTAATLTSITDATLPADTNWTGAELVTRSTLFTLDRAAIGSQSSGVITTSGAVTVPLAGFGYFVQNDPRTLTRTGEWYWKNSTSKMQVYMPGGLGSNTVEAAAVDTILSIGGSYLTIKGITIEGANKYGVCFTGNVARDSILNCQINYTGINGIEVKWSSGTVLSNCGFMNTPIRYAHNNAISVIYPAEVDDSQVKLDTMQYCGDIPGMGLSGTAAYSAIQWYGYRDSIWQNIIFHIGGSGYAQYGGDSNVIKYNYVDSFGLHLADLGGFYTSGRNGTRNWVINNVATHGRGQHFGTTQPADIYASGYYLDNGATNYYLDGDMAAWCSYNGLFDHFSRNCIHYRMTLFQNGVSQWYWQEDFLADSMRGNIYKYNQYIAARHQLAVSWYNQGANDLNLIASVMDSNYYTRPALDDTVFKNTGGGGVYFKLAQWQALTGKDQHSKKSLTPISSDVQMVLFYNPTMRDSTMIIGQGFSDVTGVSYAAGPRVLHPFESLALIQLPIYSHFP